jgi:hypothetical protein
MKISAIAGEADRGEDFDMTIVRTLVWAGALASVATLLAGCVSSGPGGMGPIAAAPRGVEGDWLSTDGVAVSSFSGGVFQTNALDTGNKLAEGSYRMADPRTVEITMHSLIRQSTTNVNCLLATSTQLNCTSATGQQFVLTRRPAVG